MFDSPISALAPHPYSLIELRSSATFAEYRRDYPGLAISKRPPQLTKRRRLRYALLISEAIYESVHHRKPGHYESEYWRMVFEICFDQVPQATLEDPRGDHDPRWDLLLHKGGYGGLSYAEKLRQAAARLKRRRP